MLQTLHLPLRVALAQASKMENCEREGVTCCTKRRKAERRPWRRTRNRCWFRISCSAAPLGGSLKAISSELATRRCTYETRQPTLLSHTLSHPISRHYLTPPTNQPTQLSKETPPHLHIRPTDGVRLNSTPPRHHICVSTSISNRMGCISSQTYMWMMVHLLANESNAG
jgi:hypothetical protein